MKLKSLILAGSAASLLALAPSAHAAAKTHVFSVDEFMAKEENRNELGDFTFVWGTTASGSQVGDVNTAGRPANGFHKDIQSSCERALLNSLIAMRDAALAKGATKVTGIHAVNGLITNPSKEYICVKNKFMAKTPLQGTASK